MKQERQAKKPGKVKTKKSPKQKLKAFILLSSTEANSEVRGEKEVKIPLHEAISPYSLIHIIIARSSYGGLAAVDQKYISSEVSRSLIRSA